MIEIKEEAKRIVTYLLISHPIRALIFILIASFLVGTIVGILVFLVVKKTKIINSLVGEKENTFDNLVKSSKKHEKNLGFVLDKLESIEKELKKKISTPKVVKFNPFESTGGNQSFCISFLDSSKNGVLLTSLFSRDNTKIYVRRIVEGKSDIELSPEENEVLKEKH